MKRYEKLKKQLLELVDQVRRDNGLAHDLTLDEQIELAHIVAREILSRSYLVISGTAVSMLPIQPQAISIVQFADCVIVNIYEEIDEDDESGIYGFGFALNISIPELSAFGYLYTPPPHYEFCEPSSDYEIH